MSARIAELIAKVDHYTEKLKDLKTELKEELEQTDMYKSVLRATMAGTDGVDVSEKDAASYAYKITLKNYKKE